MKLFNILAGVILGSTMAVGVGAGVVANSEVKEAGADTYKTLGFLNTPNWNPVKAHTWRVGGESTQWSGNVINKNGKSEAGFDIYSLSLNTTKYDNVIFNDGNNQTGNLMGASSLPENSVYDPQNNNWAQPHTWSLCGSVGGASWADDIKTSSTNPINATSATFTVTLNAGDIFKFRADSKWDLNLNGDIISGQNGTYFTAVDDGNGSTNAKVKNFKGGTYTFKINWRVENYGDKAYGISVTSYTPNLSTTWKMLGNGSRWSGDFVYANGLTMERTSTSSEEVKIENVNLAAGDQFKFNDGGDNWYGFGNIKTDSPMYSCFESQNDNIKVKADFAGTYSFFVDTTIAGLSIWITSENYVVLDTWAKSFVEALDLCDASGEEWSTYASSYAALDDDVKALFASNKVTAKVDGNYIERAAYRYERGVVIKHQTAFAEAQRPLNGFANNYNAIGFNTGLDTEQTNIGSIITIVAASVVAVATFGGYFFIRRRKHN